MNYRILWDYGAFEGNKFHTDIDGNIIEYATVDEAVKAALASGYSRPFLIVTVIDWQATV